MLKQIVELTTRLLSLTRDVQQNKNDIKEVRQEMKELRQELRDLTNAVQRFSVLPTKFTGSAKTKRTSAKRWRSGWKTHCCAPGTACHRRRPAAHQAMSTMMSEQEF